MALETYQEKIIEKLIYQEQLLSRLYRIFSEQFPSFSTFWGNLSREEARHAQLIEKLRDAARKGVVVFDEGKMRTYTLDTFIGRLEGIVEKAERNEFVLDAAFAYAIDYESALIEKNVFKRFDSIHEKAKGVLQILQSETQDHVHRIRKAKSDMHRKGH